MTAAGKTVVVVQSSFIPWKGYFDLIGLADELILLDHVQYTRRDWRNRNRIKTASGLQWLTVPVQVKGRYEQQIGETLVSDAGWPARHWRTIEQHYARSERFADHAHALERLFLDTDEELLSRVNHRFITAVCTMLGITTTISWSTDYEIHGRRTETLLGLCRQAGATTYLSGPSAASYLDEAMFAEAGMTVRWMDYAGYPEHPQLHPPFVHEVSIVDLLLNAGTDAPRYLKTRPAPNRAGISA